MTDRLLLPKAVAQIGDKHEKRRAAFGQKQTLVEVFL
jgi:hypothetical protein